MLYSENFICNCFGKSYSNISAEEIKEKLKEYKEDLSKAQNMKIEPPNIQDIYYNNLTGKNKKDMHIKDFEWRIMILEIEYIRKNKNETKS